MGEGDVFWGDGGEGGGEILRWVLKNFGRVHTAQIKQQPKKKHL